jgi:hypothetical protein
VFIQTRWIQKGVNINRLGSTQQVALYLKAELLKRVLQLDLFHSALPSFLDCFVGDLLLHQLHGQL